MIKTIFCLSMPGGHMTYLGLLTKLLLKHLPINYDYIDDRGRAHPVERFLPPHVEYNYFSNWDDWFKKSLIEFTVSDVCVFKDSWASTDLKIWESKLNSIENTAAIISNPLKKVDWYYSWLNCIDKIPIALYGHLKKNSSLFPIWYMLTKKHKILALQKSMPVFPIKENMNLKIPHFRFQTTSLLNENFPELLQAFLLTEELKTDITKELMDFHVYFIKKQFKNLKLAQKLEQNKFWEPRNMFDELLFRWIDTNPWEELE